MQTIEVGVVSIPVVVIYTKMFVAALFCALWEQEKKAFFFLTAEDRLNLQFYM